MLRGQNYANNVKATDVSNRTTTISLLFSLGHYRHYRIMKQWIGFGPVIENHNVHITWLVFAALRHMKLLPDYCRLWTVNMHQFAAEINCFRFHWPVYTDASQISQWCCISYRRLSVEYLNKLLKTVGNDNTGIKNQPLSETFRNTRNYRRLFTS